MQDFKGVYARGNRLYIRFKRPDGEWTQSKTRFVVGQEKLAFKQLRAVQDRVAGRTKYLVEGDGTVTVRQFAERWEQERKEAGIVNWKDDSGRLRAYVLPAIGAMPIEAIRPRQIRDIFTKLKNAGKPAPKTIHNIYGTARALFRDAQKAELIEGTPCVLDKNDLPPNEDKDPEWRATAIYSREELIKLVSDGRVAADRRVLYALEGIAGLRHGEAAGLRWRHYDTTQQPLPRVVVANSYNKKRTKAGPVRYMPVHPVLAAILDEWKATGWTKMMGREPALDDLIVPLPPDHAERRRENPRSEGMRSKNYSGKRLRDEDLPNLGFRHRRGHDLRRTMISLARGDGARKDLLELCTHNPRRKDQAIDLYTTFQWADLCAEVAKLKLALPTKAEPILAALASAPFAGEFIAEPRLEAYPEPVEASQESACNPSNSGSAEAKTTAENPNDYQAACFKFCFIGSESR